MTTACGPRLRTAAASDVDAMATVMAAAWAREYRGLLPPDVLTAHDADHWRGVLAAPTAAGVRSLVAEATDAPSGSGPGTELDVDAPAVAGFARFGPDPEDPDPATGHLFSLYVDPAHARAGIGRALLTGALAELAAEGRTTVTLWVFADNARARRLYHRAGFAVDGARRVDPRWGVAQIRLRRPAEAS